MKSTQDGAHCHDGRLAIKIAAGYIHRFHSKAPQWIFRTSRPNKSQKCQEEESINALTPGEDSNFFFFTPAASIDPAASASR